MVTVELIYGSGCPQVSEARARLLRAFARTNLAPRWQEWDREAPETPAQLRSCCSPTIRINGQDVGGPPLAQTDDSRADFDKRRGVPAVETIASALLRAEAAATRLGQAPSTGKGGWRNTVAVVPGVAASFFPSLTCPACWPAYAAFLSSLGLGFVNYTPYLLPLTLGLLVLAVGSLGYRARKRRGFGPFLLGTVGATLVLIAKFLLVWDPAMYGGVALLIGASLWNAWPQSPSVQPGTCPACVPEDSQPRTKTLDKI